MLVSRRGRTLGSVAVASWKWSQTARLAGCGPRSQVHGVGDGAPWILTTFEENFAVQGTYTNDFYHVSEYLAAAAPKVARPSQETQWRRRQQGRLLNNAGRRAPRLGGGIGRQKPERSARARSL